MKKLVLVVGLGLVLGLGSCDQIPADQEGRMENVNYIIKEVTFKGHLYNVISIYHGGSLSHSPNCNCNQNK